MSEDALVPANEYFTSPTLGRVTFDEMFKRLISFVEDDPEHQYNLIIGTDSLPGNTVNFVTAIVLHKVGKGGRYFYRRFSKKDFGSLRQRIFFETSLSIEVAGRITQAMSDNGYSDLPVEIHLDVGEVGDTRMVIKEVVGMVVGSGFVAKTKPDSYGASKVADHHTR